MDKQMTDRSSDWNVLLGAAGIIVTLGILIFVCYFSLRRHLIDLSKKIVKIETVLIFKGVVPAKLFAREE